MEYDDVIPEQGTFNKNIFQKNSYKKGIFFKHKDILFGKLRPYLKNWVLADFQGIAVGDWWIFRCNIDSTFIYYLIQGGVFQFVANISIGSKMPRSDWNLVSKTNFYISTNYTEQQKIGSFFKYLDELITLHQCRYTNQDLLIIPYKSLFHADHPQLRKPSSCRKMLVT